MNTWGYLILIAALLALAAFMLYARFRSRCGEEVSLHHSVGGSSEAASRTWEPSADAPRGSASSSFREADAGPVEEKHQVGQDDEVSNSNDREALLANEDTTSHENRQSNSDPARESISARPVPPESTEKREDSRDEEEYLDELQEAAAGLAMLMRSSPVQDRPSPVVFDPEEGGAQDAEAGGDEETVSERESAETVVLPVEEEHSTQFADGEFNDAEDSQESQALGATSDEVEEAVHAAGHEEDFSDEADRPAPLSLVDMLGDEVVERFVRIDESLDALETLVLGVESGINEWLGEASSAPDDVEKRDESEREVSEAA